MKIIIRHTQDSIDPSASYTDEQFPAVRESLESAYESELKKDFPDAEIEFEESDNDKSIEVSEVENHEEYTEACDQVQCVCETVFETGNFWL